MRRATPVAIATSVLLIAMGIPFLRVEFTGVDASVLPKDASGRIVDDALKRDFPPVPSGAVFVAVRGGERAAVEDYARRLAQIDGVAVVAPVGDPVGGLWRIDVIPEGAVLGGTAKDVVRAVREVPAPFERRVGGQTAAFVDLQASLAERLPIALAILCVTTLILLFLMTGSVVLPVKALIMNLLTLTAAFGLLVLIFQDGRFESLLDYTTQGALGVDPADPAVRGRVRALDRLRRVPAHADQGGARRRALEHRGGRGRARSAPAGSSRSRRCCSRSRSARSRRRRSSSSRSSASAPCSRC